MRSGARRARLASALLALAILPGCLYGFTGGGLPSSIRTVFVEPFDNTTPIKILSTDVQQRLQDELPRSLGVRLASRQNADAVVRGKLVGYDEAPVNVNPNTTSGGRVQVLQRRVQITFEAEIYDVKEDKLIWKGNSITAIGNYDPQRENVEVGRKKAVDEVVQKMIEGAQSQW